MVKTLLKSMRLVHQLALWQSGSNRLNEVHDLRSWNSCDCSHLERVR